MNNFDERQNWYRESAVRPCQQESWQWKVHSQIFEADCRISKISPLSAGCTSPDGMFNSLRAGGGGGEEREEDRYRCDNRIESLHKSLPTVRPLALLSCLHCLPDCSERGQNRLSILIESRAGLDGRFCSMAVSFYTGARGSFGLFFFWFFLSSSFFFFCPSITQIYSWFVSIAKSQVKSFNYNLVRWLVSLCSRFNESGREDLTEFTIRRCNPTIMLLWIIIMRWSEYFLVWRVFNRDGFCIPM